MQSQQEQSKAIWSNGCDQVSVINGQERGQRSSRLTGWGTGCADLRVGCGATRGPWAPWKETVPFSNHYLTLFSVFFFHFSFFFFFLSLYSTILSLFLKFPDSGWIFAGIFKRCRRRCRKPPCRLPSTVAGNEKFSRIRSKSPERLSWKPPFQI